ncbi:LysR family transcriptional regulator [Microbacteriaceae bacterium K1510]|nr:LysR family transcriptional regulator [Microbacteriaceae bacterium K1510]
MELRHLRYFRVAAEEMHIHRAAARLGIAQPPLTQQIKVLEAELGVKLFARAGRGVVLTEAGRAFLTEATSILDHVERATLLARQVAGGHVGRLRVGFTESSSFSPVLTKTFAAFRAQWPNVELELEEAHTEIQVERLRSGQLDAGFIRPPVPVGSPIQYETLASDAMMVAVPLGHPLARKKSTTIKALARENFIGYARRQGTGLSDAIVAACRRAGFEPHIVQQAPQLSSTINLVAASVGIAIVPARMRHVRPESVAFVKLTDVDVRAQLGIAYVETERSNAVRHLVDTALSFRAG